MPLKRRSAYRFSVPSMLSFIRMFQEKSRLTDEDGMSILGMRNVHHYARYRNFLLSGNFLAQKKQGYAKTERLTRLWRAFKKGDPLQVQRVLCYAPSFAEFLALMKVGRAVTVDNAINIVNPAAYVTYCTLAELSCAGLGVEDEGIYATPFDGELSKFSNLAMITYKRLARKEKRVFTGLWLETLAKKHGIHPIMTRKYLPKAQEEGLLEYSVEGSKPETEIKTYSMYYLTSQKNTPLVRKLKLYRGHFLTPKKTSIYIKIEL